MPGSSLQLNTASFTNRLNASLTCPNRVGLVGEYLFGKDSARTTKNIQTNSNPLTPTGAGVPIYNPSSVLLSGSASYGAGIAGFDTNMQFPPEVTLIAIRKKVTLGAIAGAALTWFGSTGVNLNGLSEYNGWNFYNSHDGVPPGTSKVITPTDMDFHFVAGSGAVAAQGNVYAATAGVMSTSTGTTVGNALRIPGTIKLCPAGNYQMELAYAAVYNRVLSAGEITACYDTLKAYFASRNVVVS